ncbi:MAG TPA: hypothetical protein VN648_20805, partial [Candidatus Methylomirabilis sp.]|nr:hypothetical protein [Candidatus Methylomirabilis sp.]
RFLLQRGFPYPSSAALGKIGDRYVATIQRFAKDSGIPIVHFKKGESKEETVRLYLQTAAAQGEGRVVLVGIAQEKAAVWRSWKRKGTEHWRRPQQDWGRQMATINHFYFYIWDPESGPSFWKTNAYAPFPVWIYLIESSLSQEGDFCGVQARWSPVPSSARMPKVWWVRE